MDAQRWTVSGQHENKIQQSGHICFWKSMRLCPPTHSTGKTLYGGIRGSGVAPALPGYKSCIPTPAGADSLPCAHLHLLLPSSTLWWGEGGRKLVLWVLVSPLRLEEQGEPPSAVRSKHQNVCYTDVMGMSSQVQREPGPGGAQESFLETQSSGERWGLYRVSVGPSMELPGWALEKSTPTDSHGEFLCLPTPCPGSCSC